jgi:hypothetical protein
MHSTHKFVTYLPGGSESTISTFRASPSHRSVGGILHASQDVRIRIWAAPCQKCLGPFPVNLSKDLDGLFPTLHVDGRGQVR